MKSIDRFCYKHPEFGIHRLMLYVVIGKVLVFLFNIMDTTGTFLNLLYFDPMLFCKGQIWRVLSFAIVPENTSLIFFAISLYFYYFIGSEIESQWGKGKFTIYYVSSLLITAIYSLIVYWLGGGRILVSAMYVNYSLFFAFATLWPEQKVLLFFIIPVKMKWLAYVDVAFFVVEMINYILIGNFYLALVPFIAMLVYVLFFGFELLGSVRRGKSRYKTIKFNKNVRSSNDKTVENSYRECCVCGKNNKINPEMEFRYCSRCTGYHCFCLEHINNHIHFID